MGNDFLSGPFQMPTQAPQQTAQPVQKKSGGLLGAIKGVAKGIAHPIAEFGTGLAYTPKAIYREAQGKNVDDIQRRVFGTNDSGTIAKKIIGDTVQTALTFAPGPGELLDSAGASLGDNIVGRTFAGAGAKVAETAASHPIIAKAAEQGILGAGTGAANALSQNESGSGVLNGAIGGGLTGGLIGSTSGILGKLTGSVEKAVNKNGARIATKQAEKDTIAEATQKAAEEEPYSHINTNGRQHSNMRSTLDFFKNKLNMGTDPEALKNGAALATGDNGVISGTVRKLLGDVGEVPTNDVMDRTKQALVKEAGQLGDVETKGSHANGVLRSVRDTLQGTAYGSAGNLSKTGKADANSVFDTLKNVEGRIQELGENGADAAEKRALKAAKGALEDNIYKNGALDDAVKNYKLAPEDIDAIHKQAATTGVSGEAAQHIIDGINNAGSGKELRSLQAPFVNGSKLAGAADRAGEGVLTDIPKETTEKGGLLTGRGGRYNALEAASVLGGNPIMALPLAANVAAAAGEKGEGAIQRAGESVVNAGKKFNSLPGGTNNILTRLTTQTAARDISNPEQPDVAPVQDQTQDNSAPSAAAPGFGASQDTGSQYSQANMLADIQRDPKNQSDYITLFKLLNPAPSASSVAAQQKAGLASANAQDTLGTIENSFNNAGGGQGKVGGFLANITGKLGLNSNAATYNDTATALGASLYKALGNTGTISDKDQQLIAKLIPKTTDTQTTAEAKIDQLKSLLQQAQQNSQNAGALFDTSSPQNAASGNIYQ